MGTRAFQLKDSADVAACPKCGNKSKFIARSQQVSEDCCDVWVECYDCKFNPFQDVVGSCIECVWGSLDSDNVSMAVGEWTDLINQQSTHGK